MKIFFLTVILLILLIPAFGQSISKPPLKSVVGSAEQGEAFEAFKNFEFNKLSINANNLTEEKIRELQANFPAEVRPRLIESGEFVSRLNRLAAPVFEFNGATKSRTVAFDYAVPTVFTWKETFIAFSTAALDLLTDEEITALLAHEIGHLYFAEAIESARTAKDDRQTRIIELKCDLAALTTLTKLEMEPSNLVSGVRKLIDKRSQLQVGSFAAGSPSLPSREEVTRLYLSARH